MNYKKVCLKKEVKAFAPHLPETLDLYPDVCEVKANRDDKEYISYSFLDINGKLWDETLIQNFYN